jgi:hypothetical protein
MKAEYIYALQNKSFGVHHIKIDRTTRKPDLRAREMYHRASGVPEPFDIAFVCQVADCVVAEKKIHERLKAYRIEPLPRLEADGIQASSEDCRIKSCLTSSTPRVRLPTLLIFNAAFASRSLTEWHDGQRQRLTDKSRDSRI